MVDFVDLLVGFLTLVKESQRSLCVFAVTYVEVVEHNLPVCLIGFHFFGLGVPRGNRTCPAEKKVRIVFVKYSSFGHNSDSHTCPLAWALLFCSY